MRLGWCLFAAFALAGCARPPVIAPHGVVSNNPCIDAVLAEMAAALTAGKSLSLPPLGNMRVAKTQEKGGATMMVLKLRMGASGSGGEGEKGAKQPLAQDETDS